MTENEAIKILRRGYSYSVSNQLEALKTAIKALEEVQEYRKLGTVEELREAVEKQKHANVIDNTPVNIPKVHSWYQCPKCKGDLTKIRSIYCPYCGQRLEE